MKLYHYPNVVHLKQKYCKECKGVKTVQPIRARGGEEKRKKK